MTQQWRNHAFFHRQFPARWRAAAARRRTVAHSIKDACKVATEENACLFILADNAEQLEPAIRLATKRLPHHERAALERMADPATRARARLS